MGIFTQETMEIRHNPQLSVEQAIQIFSKKYEISKQRRGGFKVIKSDWNAVNVTLVQQQDKTLFKFAWLPPTFLALFIFYCLLVVGIIAYYVNGQNLESEIAEFIRNEPAFK